MKCRYYFGRSLQRSGFRHAAITVHARGAAQGQCNPYFLKCLNGLASPEGIAHTWLWLPFTFDLWSSSFFSLSGDLSSVLGFWGGVAEARSQGPFAPNLEHTFIGDHPRILYERGVLLLLRGERAAAAEAFKRTQANRPDPAWPWLPPVDPRAAQAGLKCALGLVASEPAPPAPEAASTSTTGSALRRLLGTDGAFDDVVAKWPDLIAPLESLESIDAEANRARARWGRAEPVLSAWIEEVLAQLKTRLLYELEQRARDYLDAHGSKACKRLPAFVAPPGLRTDLSEEFVAASKSSCDF